MKKLSFRTVKPVLKKKFSQNFLKDRSMAAKIVESAGFLEGDQVIEIGCGDGALTSLLVEKKIGFLGVEIDREWYSRLVSRFGDLPHVSIVNMDFTRWSPPGSAKPYKVIGNLPYHISSQILFRLMDMYPDIHSATLMLQKEVVERIVSGTHSKNYGILSVFCQYYADCKKLFDVPPRAFVPQPAVTSSILRLQFHPHLPPVGNFETFRTLVRQSFNQRRKMLKNSIADLVEGRSVSVDLTLRPEHLSLNDFITLSRELSMAA